MFSAAKRAIDGLGFAARAIGGHNHLVGCGRNLQHCINVRRLAGDHRDAAGVRQRTRHRRSVTEYGSSGNIGYSEFALSIGRDRPELRLQLDLGALQNCARWILDHAIDDSLAGLTETWRHGHIGKQKNKTELKQCLRNGSPYPCEYNCLQGPAGRLISRL